MKTEIVGNGPPMVTVIGSIHGDEPCGANAINRFLSDGPSLRDHASVQFIIANQEALEQNQRHLDTDLNRAFPGDPNSDKHEERLAHQIAEATATTPTMSLHSTHSTPEPFVLFDEDDPLAPHMADAMPLTKAVDVEAYDDTGFVRCSSVLEVEAGCQQTDKASENAYQLLCDFLRIFGLLDGEVEDLDTTLYRLGSLVDKESPDATYEFVAENFEQVSAGDVFARKNGTPITADDEFVPILMSGEGYAEILGYAGVELGSLRLSDSRSLPYVVSESATSLNESDSTSQH